MQFSYNSRYHLYTAGMQRIDTGKAAILVAVEPMVGTLVGIMCLNESINAVKMIGIALVLGAIITLDLPEKRNNPSGDI